MAAVKSNQDNLFLPNFCTVRMVLALVVIAQLLAFVLALGPYGSADRWNDLSIISLFIQWTALTSAALLCLTRPLLKRLGNNYAALLSYVLLLAVTFLISELAYRLLQSEIFGMALDATWHREFLLRNLGISAIVSALALRYFYVQHQWKKNIESEAKARIEALQARIRPHFLFNSMNTIASLTRSRPDIAETTVQNLADLFRASLSNSHQAPLQAELELCKQYLTIENLRLGERLQVQWELSDVPGDALIPTLSLQPLLENAIYHGIEPLPEGGTVSIKAYRANQLLHILINNPVPANGTAARPSGNKIGLDNVRQRLQAFYGKQGELNVTSTPSHHTIHLSFPYITSLREDTHR